jgi:hypothetical protein
MADVLLLAMRPRREGGLRVAETYSEAACCASAGFWGHLFRRGAGGPL